MGAHTSAGRRAGLTKQDIEKLAYLRPQDFERREWVALAFAREWAWGQGSVADSGLSREFESLYTREERGRIIKLVRMMDFFNCLGNLFIRRSWKGDPHAASCPLPQAAPGQGEESGME